MRFRRIVFIAGLWVVGFGLAVWGGYMALNEGLVHGFAPICSDSNPEYDPKHCGIQWIASLPYVAVALGGLVLVILAVRATPAPARSRS